MPGPMELRRRGAGFTLIELLVVIAIIALLVSILLPALGKARVEAMRTKNIVNLGQIVTAGYLYSQENKAGSFIPTWSDGSDDGSFLYPNYLSTYESFLNPITRNIIRPNLMTIDENNRWGRAGVLADLTRSASNRNDERGGHSYEIWGWSYAGFWPDGIKQDGRDRGRVHMQRGWDQGDNGWDYDGGSGITSDVHKTITTVQRPDTMLLILDSDQGNGRNNWPDELDNWGEEGVCMGFCDGHARWVKTGQDLVRVYMDSKDDSAGGYDWFRRFEPRLRYSSYNYRGRNVVRYWYETE